MIQIENVSFQYNNSEKGALKDVSISVDKGECVLLCGVSGCGKTTTLRIIGGFERPDSGKVLFDGTDIIAEMSAFME
mgnify:CR=1 FL=1